MKQWLMWCVQSSSISVLVNGSPTPPFPMQKGLIQGDPVSSFLFNIVSESLNFIISSAKEKGLIEGILVGKDKVEVTHLKFADDALVFLPKNECVIKNFRRLLDCFGIMSGLKINYQKFVLAL